MSPHKDDPPLGRVDVRYGQAAELTSGTGRAEEGLPGGAERSRKFELELEAVARMMDDIFPEAGERKAA